MNWKSTRGLHAGLGITALGISLLLASGVAYANPSELQEIRGAIQDRGARWHADKTSVSELSQHEKKRRLGLTGHEDLAGAPIPSETAPIPEVTAAPPTLDWRNTAGVNYVSTIKNQGSCGSCWAFAVTAALESQMMLDTSGQPADLSEQILVSCSGAGSCAGGYPTTASNYIRDVGLPLESCFRYTATDNACSNACANWQDQTEKVTGWHRPAVATTLVEAMKDALYAYGPVLATMYVYNDFYSYRSGVYSYTTGPYLGAHAVLVVGYDDLQQCFIVKNSWGTGWGEAGFFQIAYSEVTGTSNFGYLVLVYDGYDGTPPAPDVTPPGVLIVSPVDGATVSKVVKVKVTATDSSTLQRVEAYADGRLLGTAACAASTCAATFNWNTNGGVAKGAHTITAYAYDAASNMGTVTVTVMKK